MSNDKESSLFISLIISLQTAAMQQLGKLLNPLTGKMERDLAQARATIDLLSALKNRTRGNLNPEEERILNVSLTELQLNFVDEMKKEQEAPKVEEEAEGEAPPVEVAEEAPATHVEAGVEEAEEKPPAPVAEKAPPEKEAEKAEKKAPEAKKAAKPKKRRTPTKGDKKNEPAKNKKKGKKQ